MTTATPKWLLLLALFAAGIVWAQAPAPRYTLKQYDPDTGSNIRRDTVSGSAIPLNMKYADLTAEQQGWLRAQYEDMAAEDEPPFPANGLGPIYKAISVAQQRFPARGPLTLYVDVNSQGEATAVSVFQSPDPQLTQAVATVLMLEKYKPAVCKGTPCAMQFPIRTLLTFRR